MRRTRAQAVDLGKCGLQRSSSRLGVRERLVRNHDERAIARWAGVTPRVLRRVRRATLERLIDGFCGAGTLDLIATRAHKPLDERPPCRRGHLVEMADMQRARAYTTERVSGGICALRLAREGLAARARRRRQQRRRRTMAAAAGVARASGARRARAYVTYRQRLRRAFRATGPTTKRAALLTAPTGHLAPGPA